MAENKQAAKGPAVHRVLAMRSAPGAEWLPLASREAGDKNADDDFLSMRLEEITRARLSGAIRPEFRVTTEKGGEPVETV